MLWQSVHGGKEACELMNRQPITTSQNQQFFRLDKKTPIRIALASLFFIYALQYPLSRMLPNDNLIPMYEWSDWLLAWAFVLSSAIIFIISLHLGMNGKATSINALSYNFLRSKKKMRLPWVLAICSFFAFWSYIMLKLNIGMTIWADFDPLPFRLTGLLFYGRLFLQPLILAYIAITYADSKLKWLVYLLFVALGAWATLTSGSRFLGILFAMPVFFLFKGKSRFIALGISLLMYITIASLSRTFYLPMVVGDPTLIQVYANEAYQASTTEDLWLLPFAYVIQRVMGMQEVMLTLKFGNTTPGWLDSLQLFLSNFFPFISPGATVSIKNIYGFDDDTFGGLGLDLFSNLWVFLGGEYILYAIGLALYSWMLGKSYRLFALGLARLGIQGMDIFIFIILFILFFDGRTHLMFGILLVAWLLSKKQTPRQILAIVRMVSPGRKLRGIHMYHSKN